MGVKLNNKYDIDQEVYLISDADQVKRIIIHIVWTGKDVLYTIRMDGELIDVYERELNPNKDLT